MATPKAKAQTARLATREEPQEDRMPPRVDNGRASLAADPNVIRNRAGEVISGGLRFTGAEDPFWFDRSIIPEGWDYQWKAYLVKNVHNTQHMTELEANHWEPVPAERHDGVFMPRGYKGNIERRGQILMERDMRLTIQARKAERKEAADTVKRSHQMAGLMAAAAPNSGAIIDQNHAAAQKGTFVSSERQGVRDTSSSQYQYTIDEQ